MKKYKYFYVEHDLTKNDVGIFITIYSIVLILWYLV